MLNGNAFRSIIRSRLPIRSIKSTRYDKPRILNLGRSQAEVVCVRHRRGAKTRATLRLSNHSDVQSTKQSKGLAQEQDGPTLPTVLRQARDNMRKLENCVLLTRVGNFYELYFEHAEKYGPLLNLKVASKRTSSAGDVAIAGFPYWQLDRFLKILVQDCNEYVAISDEFANDAADTVKSGGLLFDRKITRVISPGTLIDEKFMDPYEDNYLLTVYLKDANDVEKNDHVRDGILENVGTDAATKLMEKIVGLAWLDLSTGSFFTQTTSIGLLPSVAARIRPREVVLDNAIQTGRGAHIMDMLAQQGHFITCHDFDLQEVSVDSWHPMLNGRMQEGPSSNFTAEEVNAGTILLSYVSQRLQGSGVKLQPPIRRQNKETMSIDRNSMKALEVQSTSKEGSAWGKGSLLHTMRRTVTKSGTRVLRDWICSPSMSLEIINRRLDLVSHLIDDLLFREAVVALLKQSHDSQRLTQKFAMGRGDADDLLGICRTIEVTENIATLLEEAVLCFDDRVEINGSTSLQRDSLRELQRDLSFDGPAELAETIKFSIDEDGLFQSHRIEEEEQANAVTVAQDMLQSDSSTENQDTLASVPKTKARQRVACESDSEDQDPWIMRRSASSVLQDLHDILDIMQKDKIDLEVRLRNNLQTQSLTLRWTPGLGHICHVKGNRDVSHPSMARVLKATKSTRSFHHPEWSSLGRKIDQAKLRIRAEEKRLLSSLRTQVILNIVKLRGNAAVIDRLDIACAFATLAEEQNWKRPILSNQFDHKIINGRHPTVEMGLEEQGRAFVSNDCHIGEKERMWLITGPNMGGKSTFLRQNALISILAQAGSFVPAETAEIGLVDQIFTRVGSGDNLFRDQSTFMVEMVETASILNHATPQSFVIMDEIGRGTTPEDGIAIGFACLHHLYYKNRCRTLFASHFHSLADMTKHFNHLGCYCTDIVEGEGGAFSFVHRLRPGVNRSSHALKVAALAGVPQTAIETARSVLASLETKAQPQERQATGA
ncbi:uncharacterized protein KY384_008484 [Bacidia gigantensis]|uniref:uncharacterized protein n=1 Tax=Bacidia gigantensis TaxID=2732470 RepID=UPI001D058819|nr:uncharacterized protein KY384_008484 [Bacidia gigantensis]KAG8527055.1 hypothetical protein KY384_008484 [Bacidia gigantensis]